MGPQVELEQRFWKTFPSCFQPAPLYIGLPKCYVNLQAYS